jgi:hypothetical protein
LQRATNGRRFSKAAGGLLRNLIISGIHSEPPAGQVATPQKLKRLPSRKWNRDFLAFVAGEKRATASKISATNPSLPQPPEIAFYSK